MIFEFSHYHAYLKAFLQNRPKRGHGEVSRMARHLRVSTTYVSQVMAGNRHFTPEQAEQLAEYLGLTSLEADYFFYLVQQDRAGSESLRKFCRQKLMEIKSKSLELTNRISPKRVISEHERTTFYSNPLYSAIHLYTSTGKNGRTLEEISNRFEIPRSKAAEMIVFLQNAGLISEKGGRFSMSTQSTHIEARSPHAIRNHANWRLRALLASEDLRPDELMYTVNVSLSKKDFAYLREKMVAFITEFLQTVHDSPSEEIANLNLDFFWIRK